jgi:hypothetical protein
LKHGRQWRTYLIVPKALVTVVETPSFVRQAARIWDDSEREAFVDYIAHSPEAGDVIPGTGGIRKMRWARSGSGKRGGARVIYFYHHAEKPVYLLMVYAKARQENLTADEKRALRQLSAELKGESRAPRNKP